MPTILTPPGIDTPRERRSEVHDGDIGSGRRPPNPPADKRTGGNGDGDNWNERPQGRRGPNERLSQARIGLFFALGGDLMFFVALVSVFFVTKASGHFDPYARYINEWLPTALPSILWLNTAAIVLSSVTAEAARRAMFRTHDAMDEWFGLGRPVSRRATIWLSWTLFFGGLFLAGQWAAWDQLAAQHVFFHTNPSSHFFYLITVTHAVHLFLGIGALMAALVILQRSKVMATRQVVVDSTVWYWHTMGVLWVFLFLLLEYGQ
jgi:cytochrome c oxidase subunit 3